MTCLRGAPSAAGAAGRRVNPWRRKTLSAAEADIGGACSGGGLFVGVGDGTSSRELELVGLITGGSGGSDDVAARGDDGSGGGGGGGGEYRGVEVSERSSGAGGGDALRRHLTLFDLLSVGIGGTVGSGIFVLCGLIARNSAGPATCVSWLVAGVAAALSGTCYAELAGRVPAEGSTYVYAYVAMGELPAVIAAACLTLEYAVSGAAVSRSWGDKVAVWLRTETEMDRGGDGRQSLDNGG